MMSAGGSAWGAEWEFGVPVTFWQQDIENHELVWERGALPSHLSPPYPDQQRYKPGMITELPLALPLMKQL